MVTMRGRNLSGRLYRLNLTLPYASGALALRSGADNPRYPVSPYPARLIRRRSNRESKDNLHPRALQKSAEISPAQLPT
jgi:hypothetical protein